jgi:signal transduction histidine kinase
MPDNGVFGARETSSRPLLARRWFSTDAEGIAAERAVSIGRVLLGVSALAQSYLDPAEPARFVPLAHGFLIAFTLYAVSLLVVLRRIHETPRWFSILAHAFELLCATTLTLFTDRPTNPFSIYIIFVLMAAAYRWGLAETIATAVISSALLTTLAGISSVIDFPPVHPIQIALPHLYLVLLALIIGLLAEQERRRRKQLALVARIASRPQVERGLFRTIQVAADELVRIFGTRHIRLVVDMPADDRCVVWDARPTRGNRLPELQMREIDAAEREWYFVRTPPGDWALLRRGRGDPAAPCTLQILSDDRGSVYRAPYVPADGPIESMEFTALAIGSLLPTDGWFVRVFMVDPDLSAGIATVLETFRSLILQLAPIMHNAHLSGSLRSRAGAIERGRIARELHDGVVQSLASMKLQLEGLGLRTGGRDEEIGRELGVLEQRLSEEMVGIREMMSRLSGNEVSPSQLVDSLAQVVDRFNRETGIIAQLTPSVEEINLSPHACSEVVRIVQEALQNIRRHSGAKHAHVRLSTKDDWFILNIDDDGRGFPAIDERTWSRRRSETGWRTPRVISERVGYLGGRLTVNSSPAEGARLEISLPTRGATQPPVLPL